MNPIAHIRSALKQMTTSFGVALDQRFFRYMRLRALQERPGLRLCWLFPYSMFLVGNCVARCEEVSTAFFYGSPIPIEALSRYQRVVVEAENLPSPTSLSAAGPMVFAYLSVGEAEGWRASASMLDAKLFLGDNRFWHSRIADLTHPAWGEFLIDQRMAALWSQGYRGFFLDTLDSYELVLNDPAARARQAMALANIIRAMHARFPGVQLLFNRGFDVLPEVGHLAVGLVAESLFQGWDAANGNYVEVDEPSRSWLVARLRAANERYGLPITVIDYVAAHEIALARDAARRIRALGFTPWVATQALNTISVEAAK